MVTTFSERFTWADDLMDGSDDWGMFAILMCLRGVKNLWKWSNETEIKTNFLFVYNFSPICVVLR